MSHIYGVDIATQNALRRFKHGKMKVQIINGEQFAPLLKDAPGVAMYYPPHVPEHEKVSYALLICKCSHVMSCSCFYSICSLFFNKMSYYYGRWRWDILSLA